MLHLVLPIFTFVFGIAGLALRRWQLLQYIDQETLLLYTNPPPLLIIYGLFVVLILLYGCFILFQKPRELPYNTAFLSANGGFIYLCAMGGLLLLISVGLRLLQLVGNSDGARFTSLLTMVLSVPGGISVLLMLRCARNQVPLSPCFLATLPSFSTLPHLVEIYQDSASSPQTDLHLFLVLGGVSLTLAHYLICAGLFEKVRYKSTVFFTICAIFFNLVALGHLPHISVCAYIVGHCLILSAMLSVCIYAHTHPKRLT